MTDDELLALACKFSRYVDANDQNLCWIWTGGKNRNRGFFRHPINTKKYVRAHRAAWEIYIGPIPEGLYVLPSCFNLSCVNPRHLFLADDIDRGTWRMKFNEKGPVDEELAETLR